MSQETEIQSDIDALRERFTETQDLYREAATILFFRYGITPTANKLYQFVRKGSMSAPATALARFWSDLREKSRVRILYPDIPEGIKNTVSEFVGALWANAQAAAHDALDVHRAEAQAAIDAARLQLAEAEQRTQNALRALDECRQEFSATDERLQAAERDLAAESAAKDGLAGQLDAAHEQRTALEQGLAEARRDFAAELGKLREDLARSEARFRESEKRALLEIDRERVAAARAQKDLAQLRSEQAREAQGYRDEIGKLQTQLGEMRQSIGSMEGAAQVLRAQVERQAQDLEEKRVALSQRETTLAVVSNRLSTAQERITVLEAQLNEANSKKAEQTSGQGNGSGSPQPS